MAADFHVFALNSVSVFYQLNQTGANEQELPSTWKVGKSLWSPPVSGEVVVERGGCGSTIAERGHILLTFIRVYC